MRTCMTASHCCLSHAPCTSPTLSCSSAAAATRPMLARRCTTAATTSCTRCRWCCIATCAACRQARASICISNRGALHDSVRADTTMLHGTPLPASASPSPALAAPAPSTAAARQGRCCLLAPQTGRRLSHARSHGPARTLGPAQPPPACRLRLRLACWMPSPGAAPEGSKACNSLVRVCQHCTQQATAAECCGTRACRATREPAACPAGRPLQCAARPASGPRGGTLPARPRAAWP